MLKYRRYIFFLEQISHFCLSIFNDTICASRYAILPDFDIFIFTYFFISKRIEANFNFFFFYQITFFLDSSCQTVSKISCKF